MPKKKKATGKDGPVSKNGSKTKPLDFSIGVRVKVIAGNIGKGTYGKIKEIQEKLHFPYKVYFHKDQGHNHIWMWFRRDELEEDTRERKSNQ